MTWSERAWDLTIVDHPKGISQVALTNADPGTAEQQSLTILPIKGGGLNTKDERQKKNAVIGNFRHELGTEAFLASNINVKVRKGRDEVDCVSMSRRRLVLPSRR